MARFLGVAALMLAGLAVAVWFLARPASPDAFYHTPLPQQARPGDLIAAEPYMTDVPAGARAWRILYATTRADGAPAAASAIVMAGGEAAAPRDIVAWAHGTTGIVPGCGPSVMGKPFANVPAVAELLAAGWAYVATDYVGMGAPGVHGYLVGDEAARGVLDSVRAARRLQGLRLSTRVVVWGHSQGGNSALWTGMRAGSYAPELEVLGIAAQAPASDLGELLAASRGTLFGKLVSSYITHAYAAAYPDVDPARLVRPGLTRWLSRDIAARCGSDWTALVSVAQTFLLPADGIFSGDPLAGALGVRLRQNFPAGPFPMPLFITQGEADDLVLPSIQKGYVDGLCRGRQPVTYRTYPGRDHISLVAPASPLTADLITWTKDRFIGKPASGCP